MTFEEIADALAPEGWTLDDDRMITPSGEWWFCRGEVERGLLEVYAPAAKLVNRHPQWPVAAELLPLLRVLERDPAIAALTQQMTSLKSELARFAAMHGMKISTWDSYYPSIKATARHPTDGIAAIECILDVPPVFDLHAYHWIDDHSRPMRLSRRRHFPGANLPELLAAALHFLQLSPDRSSFEESYLVKAGDEQIANDNAYWAAFEVLR